jgi:hypothetical protein
VGNAGFAGREGEKHPSLIWRVVSCDNSVSLSQIDAGGARVEPVFADRRAAHNSQKQSARWKNGAN